jgi:hypothetical protein
MAYVGTPIDTQNQFQSLQGKRFSGDASTTAFTLDIAPNSVFDIEVFVENVRQDPNSAYTLNGTTLTFSAAPPSGTNNIYVIHQAKAVGTINPGVNSVGVTQLNLSDGSSGQFIKTDGSGTLSFASVSSALDDITTGDAASTLATSAGNITIDAQGGDTDIIFKGTDGSSDITALTLDMSEAGAATFNSGITFGGSLLASSDDSYDLGSTSSQIRKIYAGDMHLFAGGSTGDTSILSFSNTGRTNNSCTITITRQSDGTVDMDFATAGSSSIVGSVDMAIDGGSSVISGDFNDTSDIALKENITALADGAIETIKKLQPKSFTWKTSKDEAKDTDSGFIAQEVETVLPNDVHGAEGSKGINTLGIVAHLTKALQEAIIKIEDLETRIKTLEE